MENTHHCLHEKDWDKKDQEDKDLKDSIIDVLNLRFSAMEKNQTLNFESMTTAFNDKFDFIEKRMNKDSLEAKEAIRAAFEAQKETVTVALTASDKAALKAETAFEKRFDGIMELINNIAQQQKDFMPRQEADSKFVSANSRIDLQSADINKISDNQSKGNGEKEGIKAMTAVIFSVVSILLGVAGLLFGIFKK